MEKKEERCDIIRLKTPQQYAKATNQCIKFNTILTRFDNLIPAHQNFIIALAKGLFAPLNTST
jgi:hypothetical protein